MTKRDLTQELIHAMAAVSVQKVHAALGEDAGKFKSDFEAEGRDMSKLMSQGQAALSMESAE